MAEKFSPKISETEKSENNNDNAGDLLQTKTKKSPQEFEKIKKKIIEHLREKLSDKNNSNNKSSLQISHSEDKALLYTDKIPELLELGTKNHPVKIAIAKLKEKIFEPVQDQSANSILEDLVTFSPHSTEAIISIALSHPNQNTSCLAIQKLDSIALQNPNAARFCCKEILTKTNSTEQKNLALNLLGNLNDPQDFELIFSACESEDPKVIEKSLLILSKFPTTPENENRLLNKCKALINFSQNLEVKKIATEIIGKKQLTALSPEQIVENLKNLFQVKTKENSIENNNKTEEDEQISDTNLKQDSQKKFSREDKNISAESTEIATPFSENKSHLIKTIKIKYLESIIKKIASINNSNLNQKALFSLFSSYQQASTKEDKIKYLKLINLFENNEIAAFLIQELKKKQSNKIKRFLVNSLKNYPEEANSLFLIELYEKSYQWEEEFRKEVIFTLQNHTNEISSNFLFKIASSENSGEEEKIEAIFSLKKHQNERNFQLLLKLAGKESTEEIRAVALESLAAYKNFQLQDYLLAKISDNCESVAIKLICLDVLETEKSDKLKNTLLAISNQEHPVVLEKIVKILADYNCQEVKKFLIQQLGKVEKKTAKIIGKALENNGDLQDMNEILDLYNEEEIYSNPCIQRAISKICKKHLPLSKNFFSLLQRFLVFISPEDLKIILHSLLTEADALKILNHEEITNLEIEKTCNNPEFFLCLKEALSSLFRFYKNLKNNEEEALF